MRQPQVTSDPIVYSVSVLPRDNINFRNYEIRVERRGNDWAVVHQSHCYSLLRGWTFESSDELNDDAYVSSARFPKGVAMNTAYTLAATITVGNRTAADVLLAARFERDQQLKDQVMRSTREVMAAAGPVSLINFVGVDARDLPPSRICLVDHDTPAPKVEIVRQGDERFSVCVNGRSLASVNWDTHGSAGMVAVEELATNLTTALGFTITERWEDEP